MTVGERIKYRRKQLGLTQLELSKKMGYVDKSAVSHIECKKHNISTTKLSEFAKALMCTESYLLGKDSDVSMKDIETDIVAYVIKEPSILDAVNKLKNLSIEHRQTILDQIEYFYYTENKGE